jgi:hypothetical protein
MFLIFARKTFTMRENSTGLDVALPLLTQKEE